MYSVIKKFENTNLIKFSISLRSTISSVRNKAKIPTI